MFYRFFIVHVRISDALARNRLSVLQVDRVVLEFKGLPETKRALESFRAGVEQATGFPCLCHLRELLAVPARARALAGPLFGPSGLCSSREGGSVVDSLRFLTVYYLLLGGMGP